MKGAVFHPVRCPECDMAELVHEPEEPPRGPKQGFAYCPACRAVWTTEVKPGTDYAALGYELHRGEVVS